MYALKFTEGPFAGCYYIKRLPSVEIAFSVRELIAPVLGYSRVFHLGG